MPPSVDGSHIKQEQLIAWPRVAAVSAMVAFSLPTFITGIEIYEGMAIADGLWVILIASIVLTLIGGVMGSIGALTRLNSYQLINIAFGRLGARVVNIAFSISLLGWFGVNIDLFASAIIELSFQQFNIIIPSWPIELIAAALMVLTTVIGFKAINTLASTLMPILIIVTGFMLFGAFDTFSIEQYLQIEKAHSMNTSQGVAAIVGAIIIGTIILPDITRFCKSWQGGLYTAFTAYMVVQCLVLLIAAFAAAAYQQFEILKLLLLLGLGLAAFIVVIAGSWILNSLNLYSTLLSLEASLPRTWHILTRKRYAFLLGSLGFVAALANILDVFITFLIVLATIFIPVAGVIIVDFCLVNRTAYMNQQVNKDKHINKPAMFAWFCGAVVASADFVSDIPIISGIASIDAIAVAGTLYFVMSKATTK